MALADMLPGSQGTQGDQVQPPSTLGAVVLRVSGFPTSAVTELVSILANHRHCHTAAHLFLLLQKNQLQQANSLASCGIAGMVASPFQASLPTTCQQCHVTVTCQTVLLLDLADMLPGSHVTRGAQVQPPSTLGALVLFPTSAVTELVSILANHRHCLTAAHLFLLLQ